MFNKRENGQTGRRYCFSYLRKSIYDNSIMHELGSVMKV